MSVRRNLTIEQGATYDPAYGVRLDGITITDFTGYTIASQLRSVSGGDVAATFTIQWTNRATATPSVTFVLSATETAALTPGRAVYTHDAILIDPAGVIVKRLHEGTVDVTPSTTRNA